MILMPYSAHFARGAFLWLDKVLNSWESHMMGEKHKQKTPPDPAGSKQKTLMFAPTNDPTSGTNRKNNKEKRQHTLEKTMLGENTVKAKIMQSLQVLKNT